MDSRHVAAQRQQPPLQRSVSSNHRPPLPSRLSNVRSFSQPFHAVNDGARSADARNNASFLSNREVLFAEPELIDLEDEDNERPAKRAKTGHHKARLGGNTADVGNDTARQEVPGSPLPPLRKSNTPTSRSNAPKSCPTAVSRAARRANGLEPPSMAIRLPAPRNVADFHPWNGHHPEDQLSETVVKAGYFDKPPAPNSTESSSAKPTIWPNLSQKNNMGIQTLSYLFASVMEKRQAMGRCTAPSTFKPPPRVTVTDTKREAWLRDLANPDVPLRKQSRTIPHGIRGKLLMEQCLGKDIPMPRAVWLAKCVGANELRAFRRKGVSGAAAATGEQKWVREWTIAVEQFLEGVVSVCGQPEWQSKMDYAVKLATSFYSERLLERDHYLDWIVSSFAKATVDKLPIWVIVLQLYWRDVTAFGRRGRRLAEVILENLHSINAGSITINAPLKDRLGKLVMVLAVTNRGCLILPRTWEKYRYILAPKALPSTYASVESPALNIAKRNERLAGPLHKSSENTRSPVLELYLLLDNIGLSVRIGELTSICVGKVPDAHRLITAVLKWSASTFRTGVSRIYLASRLIAQLAKIGADVDGIVLEFLKNASPAQLIVANVHRVVSELVRLGCFSIGRYLQWLMVSGVLSSGTEHPLATDLLAALPLDAIQPHLDNTRRMLMQRSGTLQDDVLTAQRMAHDLLARSSPTLAVEVGLLSVTAKLVFAQRISRTVSEWQCGNESNVTLQSFCLLREGMEPANDISALADVIQCALQTQDSLLLATLADTINVHARSLAAMGRLHSTTISLLGRYKLLRTQQVLNRTCILSIKSLVRQMPDLTPDVQMLDDDLTFCDTQTSMAVCSPASDNLVSMQASHLDSDDDIDRVFDSGNTMDEQLMQRLFSRVVQRAAKAPQNPDLVPSKICQWLNKLRALDTPGFDELAKNYVLAGFKNISSGAGIMLCKVSSALVASMCMSLTQVAQAALNESPSPLAASVALRLLTQDDAMSDALHESERYRVKAQRHASRRSDHDIDVARLLTLAMGDAEFKIQEHSLVDFVLGKPKVFVRFMDLTREAGRRSATVMQSCQRLVRGLLGRQRGTESAEAQDLVAQADSLSIDYCGAALSLNVAQINGNSNHETQNAILEAIKKGSEVWPQLLQAAGTGASAGIYQWARDRVFGSLAQQEVSPLESEETARHLEVLDVAFHAAKEDDGNTMLNTIIERLKTIPFDDHNEKQLHILLHLSTLYGTSAAGPTNETRMSLLTTLCGLLAHPRLQSRPAALEYIHDVASAVCDTIPSDMLPLAKAQHHDPRLAFILGTAPSPDAWLALATNPQQQPGTTQQQRALMKQQAGRQMAPQSPVPPQQPTKAGAVRVAFPLRRWEVMPDATPTVGENDTSLSLGLFGARRV